MKLVTFPEVKCKNGDSIISGETQLTDIDCVIVDEYKQSQNEWKEKGFPHILKKEYEKNGISIYIDVPYVDYFIFYKDVYITRTHNNFINQRYSIHVVEFSIGSEDYVFSVERGLSKVIWRIGDGTDN